MCIWINKYRKMYTTLWKWHNASIDLWHDDNLPKQLIKVITTDKLFLKALFSLMCKNPNVERYTSREQKCPKRDVLVPRWQTHTEHRSLIGNGAIYWRYSLHASNPRSKNLLISAVTWNNSDLSQADKRGASIFESFDEEKRSFFCFCFYRLE